jgi:hypothetical protein
MGEQAFVAVLASPLGIPVFADLKLSDSIFASLVLDLVRLTVGR